MIVYARAPDGSLYKAVAEDATPDDIQFLRHEMGSLYFKQFRAHPGVIMVVIK